MPAGPALKRLRSLVGKALARHELEVQSGPLVVAVSGGADSSALLLALAAIPPGNRPELVAAHFSHGLRRTAEVREARLVGRLANATGVSLESGSGNGAASEEEARGHRYAFLASVGAARQAGAIATAHTQDDQAETVLLRLARGSGLRGAGAMRELTERTIEGRKVALLRPMLGASRALTEAVCAEAGIRPASDGSNRSLRYARNRVRRRVLPELAAINPTVREALARFASSAQEDEDLLRSLASDAVEGSMEVGDGWVTWERKALAKLPDALLARALELGWERTAGIGAMLPASSLRDAVRLTRRGAGGEVALGHGLGFKMTRELVVLERRNAD